MEGAARCGAAAPGPVRRSQAPLTSGEISGRQVAAGRNAVPIGFPWGRGDIWHAPRTEATPTSETETADIHNIDTEVINQPHLTRISVSEFFICFPLL